MGAHPAQMALAAIAKAYPGCWRELDHLIDGVRVKAGGWPEWCWAPMSASYAVVSRGEALPPGDPRIIDVSRLAALAAWRPTQGVYRLDEAVLDSLWTSAVEGELPVETLLHLPEWCVYVETPGRRLGSGLDVLGFWAHLECAAEAAGRIELRFVLQMAGPSEAALSALWPIPLHLVAGGTLADGALAAFRTALANGGAEGLVADDVRKAFAVMVKGIEPLLSVVLYLCAVAEEVRAPDGRTPGRPTPKPGRKGEPPRFYPPDTPAVYETGARLGAALRAAQAHVASEQSIETHTGRGVSPHVRRAHWHTYLAGPRSQPRRRIVRWQHPVFVGPQEGVVPTIHLVEALKTEDDSR